jgi:hypothetical protein
MACDDGIIPLQDRIEQVGANADLQEIYCIGSVVRRRWNLSR